MDYITLLSNSSLKYDPTNTLSRFTVKLPNAVNLDEKWYVGLINVAHTSIRNKVKIKIKSTTKTGFVNEKLIYLLNSNQDFYQYVKENNFFDRYQDSFEIKKLTYNKKQALPYIQLQMLKNVNVIIICDVEYTAVELFDTIFSQIEKSRWPLFIDSIRNDIRNFKLTQEMQTKVQEIKEKYVEEIVPNIPYYMCFYCDIIKPRIIGDSSIRCLYMKALGADTDKSVARSYQIENIQYCSIEKNNISEISILITDENGEQINFDDGEFMTSLVLHFRKGI